MKQVSAIVNARLSSSRMRNKMIRPFCGTDLLEIALEKLDKLDYFSHRFLAVAENELMEKAKIAKPYHYFVKPVPCEMLKIEIDSAIEKQKENSK